MYFFCISMDANLFSQKQCQSGIGEIVCIPLFVWGILSNGVSEWGGAAAARWTQVDEPQEFCVDIANNTWSVKLGWWFPDGVLQYHLGKFIPGSWKGSLTLLTSSLTLQICWEHHRSLLIQFTCAMDLEKAYTLQEPGAPGWLLWANRPLFQSESCFCILGTMSVQVAPCLRSCVWYSWTGSQEAARARRASMSGTSELNWCFLMTGFCWPSAWTRAVCSRM